MNKTREDANARINLARIGSLADNPSQEYLAQLEASIYAWLSEIDTAIRQQIRKPCYECNGKGWINGDGFSEDTETCGTCGGGG